VSATAPNPSALLDAVRLEMQRAVSAKEASAARHTIRLRGLRHAALCASLFGINVVASAGHLTTGRWIAALLWLAAIPVVAWRTWRQYRSITPRAATVIGEERLRTKAALSRLCPSCAAVIPRNANTCPRCGTVLRPLRTVGIYLGVLLFLFATVMWLPKWLW